MRRAMLAFAGAWCLGCVAEFGEGVESNVGDDVETKRSAVLWNGILDEYFELNTTQKLRSNSTAIMMRSSAVTNCDANACVLQAPAPTMCSGQRFESQDGIRPSCTAFMVGPRQFATASHCFAAQNLGGCVGTSVVFHWRKDSASTPANETILREHIYTCQNILFDGAPEGGAQDWVIFEVDRDVTSSQVTPRGPLPLARSRPTLDRAVDVPQHFAGLPTKYGLASQLTAAPDNMSKIEARFDITIGTSGAPWIDSATGVVLAVTDEAVTEVGTVPCVTERICSNPQACQNLDNTASPAWHMPKGPRKFSTTFEYVRRGDNAMFGDYNGDGLTDIFWYTPGATPERVWYGRTDREFGEVDPGNTNGTYITRVGDFDGDKRSDILWYRTGTATDYVEYGNADFTFSSTTPTANLTATPLIGDFDGDGRDDIFWYRPTLSDPIWYGNPDRSFTTVNDMNIVGTFTPFVGDFDGDGKDDIFWYAAGSTPEQVWYGSATRGTFSVVDPGNTNGTYVTRVGDFDGDGRSDVLWYRAGSGSDYVEWGNANRTFTSVERSVNGTYTPVIGDFDGDSKDTVLWHQPADTSLGAWWGLSNRTLLSKNIGAPSSDAPLGAGDFDGDGLDDVMVQTGGDVRPLWGKRFDEP